MPHYYTPSVYIDEVIPAPEPGLETGIPVFLGLVDDFQAQSDVPSDFVVTSLQDFQQRFTSSDEGYLAYSLHGYFANGGTLCYVYPLKNNSEVSLRKALMIIETWGTYDLVCAPDIMLNPDKAVEMQRAVLDHCERLGNCFAILDAVNSDDKSVVIQQRRNLRSKSGALYYPWLQVLTETSDTRSIPPSGHIAGIYSQTDRTIGVHKAPANEEIVDVIDLSNSIGRETQAFLNPQGINCLRQFYGRGVRVWGARTLSTDVEWRYVNVRRLVITIGRWCERNFANLTFEDNQPRLWQRIERALSAYLKELYLQGALQGKTAKQAFFVKCDTSTNTFDSLDQGLVITQIGLAPTVPSEFVILHIIHNDNGVNVVGMK